MKKATKPLRQRQSQRVVETVAALRAVVRTLKYQRDHRDLVHGVGEVTGGELAYGVKLGSSASGDLLILTLDGLVERETNWYGDNDSHVSSESKYLPDLVRQYRYGLTVHKLAALHAKKLSTSR